jgi:hypothetical protein
VARQATPHPGTTTQVPALPAAGTAVIGRIELGALRTGETVEVLYGGKLIATARVAVESRAPILCAARDRFVSLGIAHTSQSWPGQLPPIAS